MKTDKGRESSTDLRWRRVSNPDSGSDIDLNWTLSDFCESCLFMSHDWTQKKDALDLTAILVLVLLCVSWGLQQVTVKIANQGISPIWQAGIRSIGSTILLLIWMAARGQRLTDKDGTLWYGIAAGLLFALEFVLIYWGLEFTSASRAVIFLYLSPFVVAIGAQLFIPGENLRLIQVLGLICAFAGIVAAFSESLTLPTYRMLIGDGMLAAAAVFWGATTVLVKASPLAKIAPSKTLLYQLVVSAVVLPIASIAMGERGIFGITPLIIACMVVSNCLGGIYNLFGLVLADPALPCIASGILYFSYAAFWSHSRCNTPA